MQWPIWGCMYMTTYHLFEAIGLELEYMIVDRSNLDIQSRADLILQSDGKQVSTVERDGTSWSNELVSHVVELKTDPPLLKPAGALSAFRRDLAEIQDTLEAQGLSLLGTGMHPWMDPESRILWPGENGPIYRTFDRIFDCKGHGWANLQSMHLNFPFASDEEFARLMAAIRVLVPALPGLCASTPICDGKWTGLLDYRMSVYGSNASAISSVSGQVVPEPLFDPAQYQAELLDGIYRDLAPLDPDGVLQEEWVNARGAIARFERNAIEIRVIDTQECPEMDMAIAAFVETALIALANEQFADRKDQMALSQRDLVALLQDTIMRGGEAEAGPLARLFGFSTGLSIIDFWRELAERLPIASAGNLDRYLEQLLSHGSLAQRIRSHLERLTGLPLPFAQSIPLPHAILENVYRDLRHCLESGNPFLNGH